MTKSLAVKYHKIVVGFLFILVFFIGYLKTLELAVAIGRILSPHFVWFAIIERDLSLFYLQVWNINAVSYFASGGFPGIILYSKNWELIRRIGISDRCVNIDFLLILTLTTLYLQVIQFFARDRSRSDFNFKKELMIHLSLVVFFVCIVFYRIVTISLLLIALRHWFSFSSETEFVIAHDWIGTIIFHFMLIPMLLITLSKSYDILKPFFYAEDRDGSLILN